MLSRSIIRLRYVNWWSILFLFLCSTKFLTGGSLPVQEDEDLLEKLENNHQESENDLQQSDDDLQESDDDDQESEEALQEVDDFDIQPRSLTVIFTLFLTKILGKKVYREIKKNRQNSAQHQNPPVAYPPNGYPPAPYPPGAYPPAPYPPGVHPPAPYPPGLQHPAYLPPPAAVKPAKKFPWQSR